MYHRALWSLAAIAIVVLAVAGTALAVLGGETARPSDDVVFQVGDAGLVMVRSEGTELTVSDVVAEAGWDYEVAQPTGDEVVVAFSSSGTGIEFLATQRDAGVIGKIRIVTSPPG